MTFCEGYLDIHPHLGLWCSQFFLSGRIDGEGDQTRPCGAVKVVPRSSQYLDLRLLGQYTQWQRTFLYFLEVSHGSGGPLLPSFNPGLPTSRECWKVRNYGDPDAIAVLTNAWRSLCPKGSRALVI